jgi:phosphate transport system substrate-binding protein
MRTSVRLLPLIAAMSLAACGGERAAEQTTAKPSAPRSGATPIVQIDGSSTVYPVTEAVAEEFQNSQGGKVRVTVGVSGTGGGFKKFCRGDTQISNASRPILEQEIAACAEAGVRYIELPVAFDALTVVVNPQNTWLESISIEELARMWSPDAQGKVMNWSDVNPSWPNQPLKLFGAGADSGTFDYFTEATVGRAKSSRGDFTASEDDNVLVMGVANDANALGFFGFAYYAENKERLRALPIRSGDGPAVGPSIETVADGSYTPLSRPIFIYVNADAARERPEVRAFVEFYLGHAQELIREVGYVELPARAYELALGRLARGETGSVFEGHSEVGVRIDELLERTPK